MRDALQPRSCRRQCCCDLLLAGRVLQCQARPNQNADWVQVAILQLHAGVCYTDYAAEYRLILAAE